MNQPEMTEQQIIRRVELLIENDMLDAAQNMLHTYKIKAVIKNGRVIFEDDVTEPWLDKFITNHSMMLELKNDIRKLSRTDHEVLIIGPTGTGKEILAQALHGKKDGKFQACNAAGLPENLVESELFGHVKGAFTGAYETKAGLITRAKDGTFFLDEVGELSLEAQAKLLRVIQDRKLRKVGGDKDEEVTCRFVFATNKDINTMVHDGKFRLDLYARISVFELHTLGLKDRPDDIEPIILSLPHGKEYLDAWRKKHNTSENFSISNGPFLPFNVRSLQAIVNRYKVLGKV